MKNYLQGIWAARYFWLHLANAELKYKFRRSKLGLLWTMVNPLVLMLMIAIIFGNIFKVPMAEFAPYVFSGIIVWEFLVGSVIGGCSSLLMSEAYIKQFKHPLAIYPLKTTLVNITSFLIAFGGLALWILFTKPENLLIGLIVLPVTIICFAILGWPLAILTSFTNIKYRDFAQVIALVMQLTWYMSPVMFKPEMFNSTGLALLVGYNPITHILNLVRAPMVFGQFPTPVDFGFVLGTAMVFYLAAYIRIRSSEKTLIYYF
jgi:lipopolysaccharide transport system permease protein